MEQIVTQPKKPRYCKWPYGCLTMLKHRGTNQYYIYYQYNGMTSGRVVSINEVKQDIYNLANTQYQPSILKFIEGYEKFIQSL